jgi:acyl-CoA thioesterase-1
MITVRTCLGIVVIFIAALLPSGCSTKPQLPALAADATILAFGDSLTFGTGAGESESYPAVLSRLTGRKVVNAGVPGEVSALGVQRLTELLDRERPALLILCHGANDLLRRQDQQQMADNLRTMIRTARERGVSVMLVAVPFPDFSLKPPRLYDTIGGEFGIPVERTTLRQILKKGSLKSDYIHPNAAGYRLMAEALAQQLKTSGALP